jgi:hypothetical protein
MPQDGGTRERRRVLDFEGELEVGERARIGVADERVASREECDRERAVEGQTHNRERTLNSALRSRLCCEFCRE